jgi:hypothetical protein
VNGEPNVEVQHPLLSRGMRRPNGKETYRQQVRALRRLAHGIEDIMLVAKRNTLQGALILLIVIAVIRL